MIALIDYGVGNLRSVEKALTAVGAQVRLTSKIEDLLEAEKIVLPGVGAFGDGMQGLRERNLIAVIQSVVESGKPTLGICLGMQVLFEVSYERGEHAGLGLLQGKVRQFELDDLKVPHTGWNRIQPERESHLLQGLALNSYAYFNHGYYCQPDDPDDILARTEYGIEYASVVGRERLYGVQFHPEKSQAVGLHILRNFVERG